MAKAAVILVACLLAVFCEARPNHHHGLDRREMMPNHHHGLDRREMTPNHHHGLDRREMMPNHHHGLDRREMMPNHHHHGLDRREMIPNHHHGLDRREMMPNHHHHGLDRREMIPNHHHGLDRREMMPNHHHGLDNELNLFRRFMEKRGEAKFTKCLKEINSLRKKHGAENDLTWDKYLDRDATKWAEAEAKSGHVSADPGASEGDEEGELSAKVNGGGSDDEKCIKAVHQWYSQKDAYKNNGGCGSTNGVASARDFSQLVWKSTDSIGIAVKGDIVEVRLFPRGNMEEDFDLEVEC